MSIQSEMISIHHHVAQVVLVVVADMNPEAVFRLCKRAKIIDSMMQLIIVVVAAAAVVEAPVSVEIVLMIAMFG